MATSRSSEEDDATSSCYDCQCWIKALSAASVKIDFKHLFEVSYLSYFNKVLTEQEIERCESLNSTDELSSEVIKCLCKKPLELLVKIPDCLRAAGNESLANELEKAHQKEVQKPTSKVEVPSECKPYASIPVEVEQREDKGKLVLASKEEDKLENSASLSSDQTSFEATSTPVPQSVSQEENMKKLHFHERMMPKLKGDHNEFMVKLKSIVTSMEEFIKHPESFLKQVIQMESSGIDVICVLKEAFPYITESKTVSDIFDQLVYSCFNHCLDPELLVRIAETIKDSKQAEEHMRNVHEFCASLKVETYVHMREYKNSSATELNDLSQIVIKLNLQWSSCTVQQVLQAVHKFCHVVEIPSFLCLLHLIHNASSCIALTVLVPKSLTNSMLMRVQDYRDQLEASYFVEVKSNDKELFSLKDKRIHDFVRDMEEPLPQKYGVSDGDATKVYSMYQILRLCQKYFKEMLQFSHDVPQYFWKFLAIRCLKLIKGEFPETTSSLHEEQIAACFNDCVLNVSENCLDRHVQAGRGGKVALVYESVTGESERVTYKELLDRTCRIANLLRKHGVCKGQCVVIYMPLCPQAVACMLACARIGAVHCAIPSSSSTYILKQRLLDAHAVALMTVDSDNEESKMHEMFMTVDKVLSEQTFDYLKEVYYSARNKKCSTKTEQDREVRLRVNFHHIETETTDISDTCDCEPMKGNDPLFVMFTSGTTGGPKGLEHTQAGYLLYATVTYQVLCHYEPGDVMAFFTDLGWIISHSYAVHGALSSGSISFLYDGSLRKKKISWLWDLVKRYDITQLMTTPSMLASMMSQSLNEDLESKPGCLKFLMSGGEHLPCHIRKWYNEKLQCQICDSYGQTETGSSVMCNRVVQNKEEKIKVQESSLQPFFGVQPILINPQSNREERRGNACGTLFLQLPLPGFAISIHGNLDRYKSLYWGRADEHARCFMTFDGAYRDKDGGYLITGREDDVITIGEDHYDPCMLESTLEDVDIVERAAAVIQRSIGGETGVMFFVVLKKRSNNDLTRKAAYLKDRLIIVHKKLSEEPISILIVKELPTTQSGKVARHYLREIAAGRGIHSRTDLESLHKPSVPIDINILLSLHDGGTSILTHESADYFGVYHASLDYPEVFWSSLAKNLLKWRNNRFVTINSCDFKTGHVEWFKGGFLNATESCLDRHIEHGGSPVALIHFHHPDKAPSRITYKKLKEMTCQIANLMIDSQLSYDNASDKSVFQQTADADVAKKVIICMPLTPLAVASMLACARIGAVHCNVPMDITSGDLWKKFDTVCPSAIVTVYSLKEKVIEALQTYQSTESVTVFLTDVPEGTILSDSNCKMLDLEKEMKSHYEDMDAIPFDSNFPLLAIFSSTVPTTVVYHSHAGFLLHSAASHKYVLGHESGDRLAITSDLSSVMCVVYSVYGLLCNGGTAVLFNDKRTLANQGWSWKMLSQANVTQFLTTPSFITKLKQFDDFSRHPLSKLRIFGTSGKQLNKEDWYWLKKEVGRNKWTIIDHYGISEIGGCLIAPRPYLKQTPKEQAPGSPMVPFFGVSLAIFNSDKEEVTNPGVEGDLCIKSAIPGMGNRLHGDDDGRVMYSNYFRTYPGHFNTGDRATKDKDGNYHIVGKQQR